MRRIVMAASVAKRRDLILEMAGSTTPAPMLSRILPLCIVSVQWVYSECSVGVEYEYSTVQYE
jgi:hypothetical protein